MGSGGGRESGTAGNPTTAYTLPGALHSDGKTVCFDRGDPSPRWGVRRRRGVERETVRQHQGSRSRAVLRWRGRHTWNRGGEGEGPSRSIGSVGFERKSRHYGSIVSISATPIDGEWKHI